MAKTGRKKESVSQQDRNRFNMKVVTSDTCRVCKQQCPRGIRYMEKMSEPGATGYGVPCILTKGKGYK
jgi:Fe-S oxidoreductase